MILPALLSALPDETMVSMRFVREQLSRAEQIPALDDFEVTCQMWERIGGKDLTPGDLCGESALEKRA